jgi:hypothetical protein
MCKNLSNLTFEPGSRLSSLGESAFEHCSSLQSICVPGFLETISPSCFADCENLVSLVFEGGCCLSNQSAWDLRSHCIVILKPVAPRVADTALGASADERTPRSTGQ